MIYYNRFWDQDSSKICQSHSVFGFLLVLLESSRFGDCVYLLSLGSNIPPRANGMPLQNLLRNAQHAAKSKVTW